MKYGFITVLLTCLSAFGESHDGLYMLCREVTPFAGEKLELKEGKFRFWHYSDVSVVVNGEKLDDPGLIEGTYTINDNVVTLEHSSSRTGKKRTIKTINGVTVLWRDDGLKRWTKDGTIHLYSALLKVSDKPEEKEELDRPSIKLIFSDKMLKNEVDEFKREHPLIRDACSEIVRANWGIGFRTGAEYKAMLPKARQGLNADLINGLVELLGGVNDCPLTLPAERTLDDLFDVKVADSTRATDRDILIAALEHTRDRRALGIVIRHLLRVSGIEKIHLEFPQQGVQVSMTKDDKGSFDGLKILDDTERRPRQYDWSSDIKPIATGCQKWFREKISDKPK